jgi:hypothetical protein
MTVNSLREERTEPQIKQFHQKPVNMDFKNVPSSYRLVRLNEDELADAVDGWLKREHPNVYRVGTLEANATFVANVPVKVSTATVPLHASLRTPVKKIRRPYKRLNAGIGKHLKAMFGDGLVHDVGVMYQILKPNFPLLTRKKLIHNFYAISGIKNLGNNKWQQLTGL